MMGNNDETKNKENQLIDRQRERGKVILQTKEEYNE